MKTNSDHVEHWSCPPIVPFYQIQPGRVPLSSSLAPCTHAKLRLSALPTRSPGQSRSGGETGEIGGLEGGGQANAQAPRSPGRLEARLSKRRRGTTHQAPSTRQPPEALTNGRRARPAAQLTSPKPRTPATTVLLFLDCCLTSSFTRFLSFLVLLLTFLGIPQPASLVLLHQPCSLQEHSRHAPDHSHFCRPHCTTTSEPHPRLPHQGTS